MELTSVKGGGSTYYSSCLVRGSCFRRVGLSFAGPCDPGRLLSDVIVGLSTVSRWLSSLGKAFIWICWIRCQLSSFLGRQVWVTDLSFFYCLPQSSAATSLFSSRIASFGPDNLTQLRALSLFENPSYFSGS